MNISHHHSAGKRATLLADYCNSLNVCKLPKPHISRISDDDKASSESHHVKTITVLISFLKLSKHNDAWLKLGKQLLLLKKSPKKHKRYKAALACFKSAIKKHPDNYVSYYFSGLTLCLLGRHAEAVRMFDLSLHLDKLEQKIINKLQRCKIEGSVGNSMTKKQEQADETWSRYFELGMYWHGREQGDHKSLMYFRRCLQLNPNNAMYGPSQ